MTFTHPSPRGITTFPETLPPLTPTILLPVFDFWTVTNSEDTPIYHKHKGGETKRHRFQRHYLYII